jgi:hypothetical protein
MSRFPTGIDQIKNGLCPMKALGPHACMFCQFGHLLECHYPHTCEEAECDHYRANMAEEDYD